MPPPFAGSLVVRALHLAASVIAMTSARLRIDPDARGLRWRQFDMKRAGRPWRIERRRISDQVEPMEPLVTPQDHRLAVVVLRHVWPGGRGQNREAVDWPVGGVGVIP